MTSTKNLSIESMEMIVHLIQEDNQEYSVTKDFDYSQYAVSKIWCKHKRNETVEKENLLKIELILILHMVDTTNMYSTENTVKDNSIYSFVYTREGIAIKQYKSIVFE